MNPHDAATNHAAPSRRVCITAAQFNLSLARPDARQPARDWSADVGCCALAIDSLLAPGRCCLITGPSGSGKTTLLQRLAAATPRRIIDLASPRFDVAAQPRAKSRRAGRAHLPLVDLFTLPLDATIRLLAAAGLAEAPLLIQCPRDLSEGQRFRLRLALAMAETLRAHARNGAGAGVTLLADEFCASLDDETAASVATGLSRWARSAGVRVAVAAPRRGLHRFLQPQLIAVTSLYHSPEVFHVYENHETPGRSAAGATADPRTRRARRAG